MEIKFLERLLDAAGPSGFEVRPARVSGVVTGPTVVNSATTSKDRIDASPNRSGPIVTAHPAIFKPTGRRSDTLRPESLLAIKSG